MNVLSPEKVQVPSIEGVVGEALSRLRAGQSPAAMAWLESHSGLVWQSAFACNLMGLLYGSSGRDDDALAHFDRALALQPNLPNALENRARALLKVGRSVDATIAYRALAAAKPGDAAHHYGLGTALQIGGRAEEAVAAYDAALALDAAFPGADANRGLALQQLKRLPAALESYDRALALADADVATLFNRGNVLRAMGRLQEALHAYAKALQIEPRRADILTACAHIFQAEGKFEQALDCCARALREAPQAFEPNLDCANILCAAGRPADAIAFFDLAVRLRPMDAIAHCNRGTALFELARYEESLAACSTAIACDASLAQAWINRGNALQVLGRFDDALAAYDNVLNLRPHDPEVFCYCGLALRELGRFVEAMEAFDRSLALKPDFAPAINHRSALLLLLGDFEHGWTGYGGHALGEKNGPVSVARRPWPQWPGPGTAVPDCRVVVIDEHGLGDLIQYSRFLPDVVGTGAKVSFVCRPGARRLLAPLTTGIELTELPAVDAACDYQIGVAGLPKAFRPDLAAISARNTPYLAAEAPLAETWRARLGTHGFKTGICWQGSAGPQSDGHRAIPVQNFARLAAIAGVRLISLQKLDSDQAANRFAPGLIEYLGDDFDGGPDALVDAAAVMDGLDLVVTCDTSIAHLAGALGKPVWVALKAVPDQRWLLDRPDSPWYPTMRLFRQARRGDWDCVFDQILAALAERVAA